MPNTAIAPSKPKRKQVPVMLRLPEPLMQSIDAAVEQDARTRTAIVRLALQEYFARRADTKTSAQS